MGVRIFLGHGFDEFGTCYFKFTRKVLIDVFVIHPPLCTHPPTVIQGFALTRMA